MPHNFSTFHSGWLYQDIVVIGEVVSINENGLVFEPERVLLGNRVPDNITITSYIPEQLEHLHNGDFAVLFLAKAGKQGHFELTHSAFKVTSSVPDVAKIVAGPLSGGDLIAYNWFINSCGAEGDFAFDYSGEVDVVSVKRDGTLVAISQRSGDSADAPWIMVAEPSTCQSMQASWWQALLKRLVSINIL